MRRADNLPKRLDEEEPLPPATRSEGRQSPAAMETAEYWVPQVSRLFPEQCEAEGFLLRSGALDLSEEGLLRHDMQNGTGRGRHRETTDTGVD